MTNWKQLILRLGITTSGTALLLSLAACGSDEERGASPTAVATSPSAVAGGKLSVVATTVQITALAKEVGGDLIALHGIVPAGADAHDFEPTASDLVAIEKAALILRHGIGLDEWLDDTLEAGRSELVTVTDGIVIQKSEEDGEEVEDPHVWHDPNNVKLMVNDIAKALSTADPANEPTYMSNATRYGAVLDETKAEVQAIIDQIPAASRKLVTNHDAFGYFANAFGLEIVGAVIPSLSTASEPSAGDTAALLDTIEQQKVRAIFAESSVNPALARSLADDAGIEIVDDLYGDSLGEAGSGAETVDGMLLANARKIADALK